MLYSIIFLSLIQSAVIYYREMLVNRAVTVYDGNSLRKQPEDSDVLVCGERLSLVIYKNEYGNESKQTPDFTGCQRAIADYLNFLASKQS